MDPRNWHFPGNLKVEKEKADTWYQTKGELVIQDDISHSSGNLPDHLPGNTDASMLGRTTICPGFLSHVCLSHFNLNLNLMYYNTNLWELILMILLLSAWDRTWDLRHARQVLYHQRLLLLFIQLILINE